MPRCHCVTKARAKDETLQNSSFAQGRNDTCARPIRRKKKKKNNKNINGGVYPRFESLLSRMGRICFVALRDEVSNDAYPISRNNLSYIRESVFIFCSPSVYTQ